MNYLFHETDIKIITASTMIENQASANVLKKNGFLLAVHADKEDWGYEEPTVTDKWILSRFLEEVIKPIYTNGTKLELAVTDGSQEETEDGFIYKCLCSERIKDKNAG